MIQLAFLSTMLTMLSPDDIAQILITSRHNNFGAGVTRMLLYKDGNVLQVFEGEKEKVYHLFTVIQKDLRHRGVIRLYEKTIEQRDFPEWTTGFHDVRSEGATYPEGYNPIMEPDFDLSRLTPMPFGNKLISCDESW